MKKDKLLNEAVNSNSIMLKDAGGSEYKFKTYAFGERGSFIKQELIAEIVDGLTNIIGSMFF